MNDIVLVVRCREIYHSFKYIILVAYFVSYVDNIGPLVSKMEEPKKRKVAQFVYII